MNIFADRKIIILGDRNGIPAPSIEMCLSEKLKTEVVLAATECFACTATGTISPENQSCMKELVEQYGKSKLLVLLGTSDEETTGIVAETLVTGGPMETGPLSNVALGLTVYHVTEDAAKENFTEDQYDEHVGILEMVLDVNALSEAVRRVRENG